MTKKIKVIVAAALLPMLAAAASTGNDLKMRLFTALRNGDMAAVRSARAADVNVANANGETPLMYAAMYSSPEAVEMLIARGADVNAKTSAGTTALMLGTGNAEKVRLLIAAGADVNARSATGRSALLIAASRTGAGDVVKLLLSHGADPNVQDTLRGMPVLPAGAGGSTPLIEAAKIRDGRALEALLEAGAKIDAKDNAGADALAAAAIHGNTENVRVLLARGAKPAARVTVMEYTPLFFGAWRRDAQLAKMLIDAGVEVDAKDVTGATALMWAAYSDYGDPATTEVLLAAGAKIDTANQAGETAMTWARRRGNTAIVRTLLAHGAKDEPAPAEIVHTAASNPGTAAEGSAKAVALLQKSGPEFFKVSGCISCHNQSIPQMATGMARSRGIADDDANAGRTQKAVLSIVNPARLPMLEMSDVVPDVPMTMPYVLLGMNAESYGADEYTDAGILNLAAKQFPNGSWRPWAPRPPLEFSSVTSTALSIRALQLYAPPAMRAEMDSRIASARAYLCQVTARTMEEKSMKLLGLYWSGASKTEIATAAKAVSGAQREDGGWAQLDTLPTDAYATGQALYALRIAGGVAAADARYRRGTAYLLRTQEADGSWHVATRSFPFQPYKESGFPHGRDQWISSAGTGWAAMALILDQEPAASIARR
ncbi:MAG: ankyrin repeat domain-containing protein [Acidobacteriia bacterium]|nr:ankyrin repeat domain-containing protein [Terriglobia bacterium]